MLGAVDLFCFNTLVHIWKEKIEINRNIFYLKRLILDKEQKSKSEFCTVVENFNTIYGMVTVYRFFSGSYYTLMALALYFCCYFFTFE
jgi:hypothetical protein